MGIPGNPRAATHFNVVLVGASMGKVVRQALALRAARVALTVSILLLGNALARGAHGSRLAAVHMTSCSSGSGLPVSSSVHKARATCPGSSRRLGCTCHIWESGAAHWRPVQPKLTPRAAASKTTTRRPCLDEQPTMKMVFSRVQLEGWLIRPCSRLGPTAKALPLPHRRTAN